MIKVIINLSSNYRTIISMPYGTTLAWAVLTASLMTDTTRRCRTVATCALVLLPFGTNASHYFELIVVMS